MQDFIKFLIFFKGYILNHLFGFGGSFEKFKDVIVAFLIVKRGKYSNSFLNTSFLLLVVTVLVGGPAIAENNPLLNKFEQKSNEYAEGTISYNPSTTSFTTVFSAKPRDSVIEYQVKEGDTLASIAEDYDVTVQTIKWENDLDSDEIKKGDKLRIPPITGVVHEVESGDTVYSIADEYHTDAQKIVNFPFNDFEDLETFSLNTGQVVYVPDGVLKQDTSTTIAQNPQPQTSSVQEGVHGSSTFVWPTSGIITQYPVWYHMALDIASNALPAVIASDTGTVVYSGCLAWGYGCHVIVDHGNGYQTLYAHLSSINVSAGQVVNQGQVVGFMGSTGRSTGPHLHFEIRSNGAVLNPLNFL
jgi:murein DD-endopeptidase MepM/ murein hydrolase activator NlpD